LTDQSESTPEVVDLADRPDAAELLRRLYDEILVPSFRKEELEPLDMLAWSLDQEQRNTDVAAACDESGEILGAMIGDWDPPSGVYLLSYLAARPGLRSRGVGTCLMEQLPVWSRARRALVTLAEVDDPRCHHNEGLVGDPTARLAFYGRFGARVLELPYFQPSLGPDGQRAHGMLLIAFDVDDAGLTGGPVPALRGDVLGTWLRGYFVDAEGLDESQENGDDVDRARILDQASAAAGVRILPLDQYTEVSRDIASA
jgi:GNAT superfamily N-acetyltransferase